MKDKTQKQILLSHLKKGGSVTSFESYLDFGITQLATRIKELEEGLNITFKREWIKKNNKRFIKYSYER